MWIADRIVRRTIPGEIDGERDARSLLLARLKILNESAVDLYASAYRSGVFPDLSSTVSDDAEIAEYTRSLFRVFDAYLDVLDANALTDDTFAALLHQWHQAAMVTTTNAPSGPPASTQSDDTPKPRYTCVHCHRALQKGTYTVEGIIMGSGAALRADMLSGEHTITLVCSGCRHVQKITLAKGEQLP